VGSDPDSPWNVLAYEVELKGRDAAITRKDFEQCVGNFKRFGQRPVVLFHADMEPEAHPESRKAHAWITELRVGSMSRNGTKTATLEGRFSWVNKATQSDVQSGALAYGSITLIQDMVDEETGANIGSFLWSFSLTNTPALTDLPRLAAEQQPHSSKPTANKQERMEEKLLLLAAARLGVAVATEDEARDRVIALAAEAVDVRKALGSNTPAETASRLSSLSADAARVPALTQELAALKDAETKRIEAQRTQHIEVLCKARPELAPMRPSLEFHAKADWEGFARAYPLPEATGNAVALAAENAQLKTVGLTTRVTPQAGAPSPQFGAPRPTHRQQTEELAAKIRAENPKLSEREALLEASRRIKAGNK
jgi:hypothetical protein